jgi:general stress protein YciG
VNKPRGFAALSPERRREISAMGGAAGKDTARGFAVMPTERVQELGRKGGQVSRRKPLTPTE